ncbi:MAG: hypothetical protein EXS13_15035 [Planctomycetes bacterium]|nr:hypothetical protein [Planctomycetota bacterium]
MRRLGEAPLAPRAAAQLAALNAEALEPFHARRSPVNGAARTISGGRLGVNSADPVATDFAEAALEFLDRFRELFALPANATPAARLRGRRVEVSYSHDGLPILGLDVSVSFDGHGELVAARASVPGPVRPLGTFLLRDDEAAPLATQAVEAEDALRRRRPGVVWTTTRSRRAWRAEAAGLVPVVQVTLQGDRPGELFEVTIDARDGVSRRVVDRVRRGDGLYPYFGQFVPFSTKSAKGLVFKSVDNAIDGIASTKSLKNWSKGIGAPVDFAQGFLVGAHVDIWDDLNTNLFSASGNFKTSISADPDGFDQVNTYYQVDTFFGHLDKQLLDPIALGHALPILINVKTDEPNAFFVADFFPIDGHTIGYIQFNDIEELVGPEGDFSRDPTVVAHEYTHAWLAFEGESFEDPLDYPTRAVGEAIPDFFACAWQDEVEIGTYLDAVTGLGLARNLQDDDELLTTLLDAIDLTASGLPEEHRAGEIFGSLLTDLRLEIGTKDSERLVFASLPFLPDSVADIGIGVVDANNAFDASAEYLFECAVGLADSALEDGDFLAVLGAATSRAVIGDEFSFGDVFFDLSAFKKNKVTIPARFVAGDSSHSYFFVAQAGSTLKVTIKADKDGALPDFDLFDGATGSVFPAFETKAKSFTSGDRKVTQSGLELLLGDGVLYEIEVLNFGLDGAYTLTLDV